MARRNQEQPAPEYRDHRYGALARSLLNSEESKQYVPGAIATLAGPKGYNLGKTSKAFVEGTLASDEGVSKATSIASGDYDREMQKASIGDLADYYSPMLRGLDAEEKSKLEGLFSKYSDMSFGKLIEEMEVASDTIKRSKSRNKKIKGSVTQESLSDAKKTYEKYGPLYEFITALEGYNMESLRPDAVEATRTRQFKDLASKL